MSRAAVTQKLREHDVYYCKKWLCDDTPITVQEGVASIVSESKTHISLNKEHIQHLTSTLLGDIASTGMLCRVQEELPSDTEDILYFGGSRISCNDGIVSVDDVITIEPDDRTPDLSDDYIVNRPKFIKLIYQSMSCFPGSLYAAYTELTGETLVLNALSKIRGFYEHCATYDSWTALQFCAYISHCDPKILDFMPDDPERRYWMTDYCRIFPRLDIYEANLAFVKAAILGEAFEVVHLDEDNWEQSFLRPKKGMEWAKRKEIDYHPLLDEFVLGFNMTPAIFSEYTTPYLEMMREVINELEISKENQGKKEAIAASFAKKLSDHKATPFEAALKEENGKFMWRVQTIENVQLNQIFSLHKEGLTQREISQELGLGLGTVNRKLKEGKERRIPNGADK